MLYPKKYYDEKESKENILSLLSTLFSSNLNVNTKLSILENKYGIIMTKEEKSEVLNMCTLSEAIKSQGLEEGRLQERKRAILALLSENFSKKQIIKLGYTEKEINEAKSK